MAQQLETIGGTIERTNDHGFTLSGRPGWLNISKYADPVPTIPAAGTWVVVAIDKGGFVRSIQIAATSAAPLDDGPEPIDYLDEIADEPRGQHVAEMRERVANERPATREEVITRLACLKAATHLAVTALPADMDAVTMTDATLRIADRLEAWATRPA